MKSTKKQASKKTSKAATPATVAPATVPAVAPVTTNAPEDKSAQGTVVIEQNRTIVTGDSEATQANIKIDCERVNAILNGTQSPDAFVTSGELPDLLTTCVKTWNQTKENTVESIGLRDPATNILARFEYVPQTLKLGKIDTGHRMLVCSDNLVAVGKPFAASYGLIDNGTFLDVCGLIIQAIEKLGHKAKIATTGALQNRERTFLSIEIEQSSRMTVDGREIQAFLNCLNSIPSNAGCTVTFANNTFTVCCRNTFAHVLQNGDGAKFHAAIKHTKNCKAILSDVPKLVEAYISGNERIFKTLKHFAEFQVGLVDAEEYFAAFLSRNAKGEVTDKTELSTRTANMVETLQGLFIGNKGTKTNKGVTAFDLFNAVTEYYTHYSAGDTNNKDKQFQSSEAGSGYVNKGEFYQWLVKHTQERALFNGVAKVGNTLLLAYRKKS